MTKVIRAFRYPLLPNKSQEKILEHWLGFCSRLYNAALQERRDAWKKQGKRITRYDQQKSITVLRAEDEEARSVPIFVARSATSRVDEAFKAFFRRCKRGGKPGYPRFRSRHRYDSFSIGRASVDGQHVNVPKLGPVRFKLYRSLRGKILDVQIKRSVDKWYVIFTCDVGAAPEKVAVRADRVTGIDLGLSAFATLSNGKDIPNPRFLRKSERILAQRQRILARRKKRSKSRERTRKLVAKAYERIRNQRLDYARKTAKQLFDHYDLIAYEDLNIRRMIHSLDGHLAKSINDAAWAQFIRCLALKAEEAGKHLIAVDPRGTTQKCSGCGEIVKKTLSEREHRCDSEAGCGLVLGRDHNAARNILALGLERGVCTTTSCSGLHSPKPQNFEARPFKLANTGIDSVLSTAADTVSTHDRSRFREDAFFIDRLIEKLRKWDERLLVLANARRFRRPLE